MNASNEKISVIIPTYNQADLLKKAIQSVLNQTYKNWELIIINNYSTDNTEEIVENFEDQRIKIFNFKNNGVIAASRNYGLNKSTGKYISFLDSDDFWVKEKMEKTFKFLKKDFNFIFHNEIWLWPCGFKKKINYGPLEKFKFKEMLLKGNTVSTSSVTIEKNFLKQLKGFNESKKMIGTEDYDLWLRISLSENCKAYFIKDYLGYYVIHSNNNSKNFWRQLSSEFHVIDKNMYFLKQTFLNKIKMIIRKTKAILGSILKLNNNIYKLSIKIRK